MWSSGIRSWAIALALSGALSGCAAERVYVPPVRWIEADPQVALDRRAFVATETVFDLAPSEATADRWQSWGDLSVAWGADHARISSAGRWGGLSRAVDLDADSVDAVNVSVDDARRVMVDWAGPDGTFDSTRRVEALISPHTPASTEPVLLKLAGHPQWRGRIRGLRIGVVRAPNKTSVRLGSVTALRERIDPDRLAETAARPWKVEIDHEVRNAWIGLPQIPIVRELEVPAGGVLRFGFGVEPRQMAEVSFVVTLRPGDLDAREVFRRAVAESDRGIWHEAEVDLSAYTGARVHLNMVVESDGLDPRFGMPLWSNPEVLVPGSKRPPNLVLISIDTLRADRLSLYGHDRSTSPVLDRWAAGSAVVFENTVAQAPWTLPSHVSLFTGLETFHHGVNFREQASASFEMLAEAMRREGYVTAAVTGGGFVHPSFGFSQGFDSYRYWSARYESEHELEDGIERSLSWLDRQGDRPYFLFFHTFEVHGPYRARQPYYDQLRGDGPPPPEGVVRVMDGPVSAREGFRRSRGFFTLESPEGSDHRVRLGPDDVSMVSLLYDSQVAYMDAQIGRLLERVAASGPTTIVFTSDHGEVLGERGDAGHGPLDDTNLMVPLVVAFADGRGAGARVRSQVRSIDILPTLLEAFGIEEVAAVDGQSMMPLVSEPDVERHRPAWAYNPAMNLGIAVRVDDRYKYIFNDTAWKPVFGTEGWFDLERDPIEGSSGEPWAGSEALRAKAGEALSEATGWRLHIVNRSVRVFTARLRSDGLQPAKVKREPEGRGVVRWRGHGASEISVDADSELTLNLLAGELSSVVVATEAAGEGTLIPSTESEARLAMTAAGWGTDEAAIRDAEVLVELRRVGSAPDASGPAEVDPELHDRLEALGYVQ